MKNQKIDYTTRLLIWSRKAPPIKGHSAYRHDIYGNPMRFDDYGDITSPFGWEIDHIIPRMSGGTTDFSNLQALQ